MTDKINKVVCLDCSWHGTEPELLRAANPFDTRETITGCPDCKCIESTYLACEEFGCWAQVSSGTPTPTGYRQTCHKHSPKRLDDEGG